MTLADQLNSRMLPFGRHLGITITEASPEAVLGSLVVRPELCTRPEIAHGGALMSLADNVAGMAAAAFLGPGQRTTTIESKANFMRAAPLGAHLNATASSIHLGRRTQVWQTHIRTEDRRLVAVVTQTQLVF